MYFTLISGQFVEKQIIQQFFACPLEMAMDEFRPCLYLPYDPNNFNFTKFDFRRVSLL